MKLSSEFLFEVKSVQNSDDGKAATVDRNAPEIVESVIPEPPEAGKSKE